MHGDVDRRAHGLTPLPDTVLARGTTTRAGVMTLLVGAVRRGSVCFITMYSVRQRYDRKLLSDDTYVNFFVKFIFSNYVHDFWSWASTTEPATHFLPRDAMLVRSLSVWCRAVGRFLENRFQPVELTHTGKSRAAS